MSSPSCSASSSSALSTTGERNIRALIVVCRYLGDVLLATPLARSLQQAGYQIDWLVASGTEALIAHQSFAHSVFTISASVPWQDQLRLAKRLWRQYDRAFVLTASDRPMLLALAAAQQTYALIPAHGHQYAWKRFAAHSWIPYEAKEHMVWRAMQLAALAGLPECADVGIEWSDADRQQACQQLPWHDDAPYIQIHPFARWRYKWWPQAHWRTLIESILDSGLRVVITGSPAEQTAAEALIAGLEAQKATALAGAFSWQQLACLSAQATAYIGLDTANTHLAASTGTPVVTLFGPTDPRIWGPWSNGSKHATPWQASTPHGVQRVGNISLLQGTNSCVPCQMEGCQRQPESDSDCLQTMTVESVWAELQHRLNHLTI